MDNATCSRCPAFLYSEVSRSAGVCYGCRSGPPEMRIHEPPPARPKPEAAELQSLIKSGPLPGSLWEHRKGGIYRVVSTALREDSLDVVVVYADGRGVHWVRPLAEFADGRFKPVGEK